MHIFRETLFHGVFKITLFNYSVNDFILIFLCIITFLFKYDKLIQTFSSIFYFIFIRETFREIFIFYLYKVHCTGYNKQKKNLNVQPAFVIFMENHPFLQSLIRLNGDRKTVQNHLSRRRSRMKKKSTAPTMKDVAREAGVALGTVSKVVNGLPVGESYKKRVEDAIKKLDYQVNSYAQGLKSNRTYTIAFLVPNTREPFWAELTNCINVSLQKRKYRMLLCTTDHNPDMEQEYVTMARQNKVDGIIGLTYNPNLIVDENIPFISIDRCISPHIPCIASDNFAGGQMAAEKLADLGCRRVAFLRIGSSLNNEPNKRKAGFENGCLARGLDYSMKILQNEDSLDGFYTFLTDHIMDGKLEFDGLFCVTDRVAYYVVNILRSLNIRVPEDVQVIGFDGIQHFGDFEYTCSTIVQPVKDLAEMCVEFLLQENLQTKPPLVCLPVTYAYGGTTLDRPDNQEESP